MFNFLEFGGIIFYTLLVLFLVLEAGFIYSSSRGLATIGLVIFGLFVFLVVGNLPNLGFFLLLYPVLALAWMPVYWYLSLQKTARELKKYLKNHTLSDIKYGHHLRRHIEGDTSREKVIDIKHPYISDIVDNTILFPISIPLFFLDNFIDQTYEFLKERMEQIRLSLSNKVNDELNKK